MRTRFGRSRERAIDRRVVLAVLLWLALEGPTQAGDLELGLPIKCELGRTCEIQQYVDHGAASNPKDYRCGTLTYSGHNGTDFRLPTLSAQRAGVDVLAAADGRVLRTRNDMPDRLLSEADTRLVVNRECGNGLIIDHGDRWETQYCHLAQGSLRASTGDRVKVGQTIGQVGLSGQTEFPHLHLTVRHLGEVIDPFAFGAPKGSCGAGQSLWSTSIRNSLSYRARSILNSGFASGPVTMEQVELGEAGQSSLGSDAQAIVAFVRAIGLKAGDVQHLSIMGPGGQLLVAHTEPPLDRNRAQSLLFVGKKKSPLDWPAGRYEANYQVTHDGEVEIVKVFTVAFD